MHLSRAGGRSGSEEGLELRAAGAQGRRAEHPEQALSEQGGRLGRRGTWAEPRMNHSRE